MYELLTGTKPLEREMAHDGYIETLQRIREDETPPPSTRFRRASSVEIAARRRSDPSQLPKLLRRDLDWIVMKALDKERSRRYETANGFAGDLQRFLAGEPIEAAPPSAFYRARKLVRKHRAWMATAAAFTLLLLAAVIVSSWMAVRATRAEREAVRDRNIASSVSDFLRNDVLAQASAKRKPGPRRGPTPTSRFAPHSIAPRPRSRVSSPASHWSKLLSQERYSREQEIQPIVQLYTEWGRPDEAAKWRTVSSGKAR